MVKWLFNTSKDKPSAGEEDWRSMPVSQPGGEQQDAPTLIEGKGGLAVSNIGKQYAKRPVVRNVSLQLRRGEAVGLLGPNGAGKTTLFRMITGQEKPDSGDFKVGDTVKVAYIDQSRTLDPNLTVFEAITDKADVLQLGNREVNSRNYVSRFNFSGGDQQKKVGDLSGGEKNRVYLAKMLREGANLLLLDEPTNDLDVNTMRALEEALLEFGGSAVVISHDRWFLDRICTHTLAFVGNSEVEFYNGNYSEYEEDRKKRLGVDEILPTRIKYRKLN